VRSQYCIAIETCSTKGVSEKPHYRKNQSLSKNGRL
jgi:hypothetical protein